MTIFKDKLFIQNQKLNLLMLKYNCVYGIKMLKHNCVLAGFVLKYKLCFYNSSPKIH